MSHELKNSPSSPPLPLQWQVFANPFILRLRNQAIATVQEFFRERQVLEVAVPSIATFTATDPHTASLQLANQDFPLYLQTSPEAYLKNYIAEYGCDVFSIAESFRDDFQGRWHQPQFTLIEWYRHDFSWHSLALEVIAFIYHLQQFLSSLLIAHESVKPESIEHEPVEHESTEPFKSSGLLKVLALADDKQAVWYRYDELCCQFFGQPYHEIIDWQQQYIQYHQQFDLPLVHHSENLYQSDWHDLLWADITANQLKARHPNHLYVIYDYPSELAIYSSLGEPQIADNQSTQLIQPNPLTQSQRLTHQVAKRFEVFLQGVELANGWLENIDSQHLQQMMQTHQQQRKAMQLDSVPIDQRLVDSAQRLTSMSGVALGFDRLLALLLNCSDIRQIKAFALV